MKSDDSLLTDAFGLTPPLDGVGGYATGAIFTHLKKKKSRPYINQGTGAESEFVKIKKVKKPKKNKHRKALKMALKLIWKELGL